VRVALVTGAAGFVGANLARRLVRDGHSVHLVTRDSAAAWRLRDLRHDAEMVELDLRDSEGVRQVVAQTSPEWVFHLAAYGAYSWEREVQPIFATNLTATINLLEAARETGFDAFVHAGSSSEYGFKDHPPSEDEPVDPNSDYAVAKAAATMQCRYVARANDVHAVTLRLYSVYGPWEDPRRLVPRLIVLGRRGLLPPLARPDTARDFVFVDDVVEAFVAAASRPDLPRGSILNVGSGTQTSLRDAVETARTVLGVRQEPRWETGHIRDWDTNVWVADTRRIRSQLRWIADVDFAGGLSRTVEWLDGDKDVLALYEATGG
jgi:nucleoside-diphosphate-sugar epimerase